jgi:hypothetical protein
VLYLLVCLPVLWRRNHPVAAVLAGFVVGVVQLALDTFPAFSDLALVVLVYSAVAYGPRWLSVACLLGSLVAPAAALLRWGLDREVRDPAGPRRRPAPAGSSGTGAEVQAARTATASTPASRRTALRLSSRRSPTGRPAGVHAPFVWRTPVSTGSRTNPLMPRLSRRSGTPASASRGKRRSSAGSATWASSRASGAPRQ